MPRFPLFLALVSTFLFFVPGPAVVLAQNATPESEQAAGAEIVLRLSDSDLGSTGLGTIGFVRAIYDPGAEQALSADEGPTVLWVESGSLSIVPDEGSSPLAVSDGGSGVADNLSPLSAGEEAPLEAGHALVLPAGSAATVRNTGDGPAMTLDLLPLADVETQPSEGVAQRLVARHDTVAPSSPFVIELGRATIQPGKQYPEPANAVDFLLMSVDPAQLFVLTRNNFNRGASPMDIYVLTITPVEGGVTTPTA